MNLGDLAARCGVQGSPAALAAFAAALTAKVTVERCAIRAESGVIYDCARPSRHDDVIAKMVREGADTSDAEFGFLLSDGKFASRDEAARVALAAGQCSSLAAPPYLYSEDLW